MLGVYGLQAFRLKTATVECRLMYNIHTVHIIIYSYVYYLDIRLVAHFNDLQLDCDSAET